LRRNQISFELVNKKNAKTVLVGIGKVFYYFGMGLWIFCKLLGRGIQRAYYEHEARKRLKFNPTNQPYYDDDHD
jgi:hypothetical protein